MWPQVLFDRNYEDAYTDPGSPATARTPLGTYTLAQLAGPSRRLLLQVQQQLCACSVICFNWCEDARRQLGAAHMCFPLQWRQQSALSVPGMACWTLQSTHPHDAMTISYLRLSRAGGPAQRATVLLWMCWTWRRERPSACGALSRPSTSPLVCSKRLHHTALTAGRFTAPHMLCGLAFGCA